MKNKFKIVFLLSTTLIIMLITKIVYANEQINNSNNEFFSVNETKASVGDTITMTIDLSKIYYDNFEFSLSSNTKIDENEINSNIENNIQKEENDNTVTITSNKNKIELGKIELYYIIPETFKVNDKITLEATIKNTDNEEDNTTSDKSNSINNQLNINTNTINNENKIDNDNQIQRDNTQKVKLEIEIVEKTQEGANNHQNGKPSNENTNNTVENNNQMTSSENFSKTQTSSIATTISTENTENYKGSSNNYLNNILVEGYNLTPDFSLTNTTYFLTVENSVTSINISTTKYEQSETVKIYGNENLLVGQNKVIISVTAENGNVRIYRIYVNREK